MTSIQSNTPPAKGVATRKRKSKKLSSSENITAITGGSEIAATLLGDKITDSANGSQAGREKAEKEYIKEVSKRLRKQTKKMDSIRWSEDKIKDLPEEEHATTKLISSDERSKIATKPITSAVFKELNEIHEVLKKVADLEDKRVDAEKVEADAKFGSAISEAREEGYKAGAEEATAKILTVVRFLRLAGYRRQFKSLNDHEDDAIEKLLALVYGGDQTAVDACLKLANGSKEVIDDLEVTYAQIKEVAHSLKVPGEEEQSEEPEAETADPETVDSAPVDTDLTAQEEGVDESPTHTATAEAAEEGIPLQTLTNGEVEVPAAVPAVVAANETSTEKVETIELVEAALEVAPETQATSEEAPIESAPATDIPELGADSWADDEVKVPEAAVPAIPENKEGEFQSVERRGGYRARGGHRPRGDGFRGYRGRGGRGQGEYRGRGGRGDGDHRPRGDGEFRGRGDGEYRGRGDGEYRGRGDGEYRGRGDGEYRGRGDGEYRGRGDGEYRGRGGYRNRERGDGENRGGYRGRGRGEHHHHQGPRPQPQQSQQLQEPQEPQPQAPQEPQEPQDVAPAQQPAVVST